MGTHQRTILLYTVEMLQLIERKEALNSLAATCKSITANVASTRSKSRYTILLLELCCMYFFLTIRFRKNTKSRVPKGKIT